MQDVGHERRFWWFVWVGFGGLLVFWFGEWTVALGKKSQTEHVFLSF